MAEPVNERLFEAERVTAIIIIVAMPTEQPVTRFFIARNGSAIVLVDFEPHRPPPAVPRRLFRGREKERSDAAPPDMRGDRDRIKPGERRTRRIEHQHIACEFAASFRHHQRCAFRGEKTAKATPRQDISRKDGLLDRDERGEIGRPAAAEFCGR